MPSPLPRRDRSWDRFVPLKATTAAFPEIMTGRLPHLWSFEACSAFTHVTACLLAKSPEATLSVEGFDDFVTSIVAPTATGWNDSCRAGFAPAEDARLCTAHNKLTLRARLAMHCPANAGQGRAGRSLANPPSLSCRPQTPAYRHHPAGGIAPPRATWSLSPTARGLGAQPIFAPLHITIVYHSTPGSHLRLATTAPNPARKTASLPQQTSTRESPDEQPKMC